MESQFFNLAEKYGLLTMAIVVFVWWLKKDNIRLADRLSKVEDDQRGQLTDMVKQTNQAIVQNTAALQYQARTSELLIQTISTKPCGEELPRKLEEAKPHA